MTSCAVKSATVVKREHEGIAIDAHPVPPLHAAGVEARLEDVKRDVGEARGGLLASLAVRVLASWGDAVHQAREVVLGDPVHLVRGGNESLAVEGALALPGLV